MSRSMRAVTAATSASVLLAAATGVYLATGPVGASQTTWLGSDGVAHTTRTTEPLVTGAAALLLAVPMLLFALPLLFARHPAGPAVRAVVAGCALVGVLLTGFTVGPLYAPAALTALAAAIIGLRRGEPDGMAPGGEPA